MEEIRQIQYLKIDDILPNRFQPRIKFDDDALKELSESIKEYGVLQPITVRPLGDKYEIIAGERRYKASVMAKKETVPAVVVDLNDGESAEIALIENVQRQDLTPIEEAISYKKILDIGHFNQENLALKLGKKQSTVANKLRLLNLSDASQEALLENKISERHARSLLRIKDKEKQELMLDRIIKERLTVRKTDEEIEKMNNKKDIEVIDFDMNDKTTQETIPSGLEGFDSLYNIPSAPIQEDREVENMPIIPNIEVNEVPNLIVDDNANKSVFDTPAEEKEVNPGFLDINKIENEAVSINAEPKKISLEDLLRSPDVNVSASSTTSKMEKQEETSEQKEEFIPFKPGKFFEINEESETNPFVSKTETPVMQNEFVPNVEPKIDEANIFQNQFVQNEEINTEETPIIQPINNIFSSPIIEDINENDNLIENNTNNFENGNLNKTNEESLEYGNMTYPEVKPVAPAYMPMYEDDEIEEKVDNNKYGVADLRTVINTVRECSKTIEKYGYVIDTEEFDFEDMYQVIFKIQKKH